MPLFHPLTPVKPPLGPENWRLVGEREKSGFRLQGGNGLYTSVVLKAILFFFPEVTVIGEWPLPGKMCMCASTQEPRNAVPSHTLSTLSTLCLLSAQDSLRPWLAIS